jgi:hypothetical protein
MFQRSSTYVVTTKAMQQHFFGGMVPSFIVLISGIQRTLTGLYDEDGPPSEIADRINASYPNPMRVQLAQRQTRTMAEADQ